jgi:hypothetical protein
MDRHIPDSTALALRSRLMAAVFAGAYLFASAWPLTAQEEELWQALLREQLATQFGCKLNYTTNVHKFELGGQQMLEARAHCFDERSFDVWWLPNEQRFEIKSCEPVTC